MQKLEQLNVMRVSNGWRITRYGNGGQVGATDEAVFMDTPHGRDEFRDWLSAWLEATRGHGLPIPHPKSDEEPTE